MKVLRSNLHCRFKGIVFGSSKAFGKVYQTRVNRGKDDNSGFVEWGQLKCIPHSRCVPADLLSPKGSLFIQVKIDLLGENCPGGIQDQSGLKHKLDKLDKLETELTGIKSKLRKIEENQSSNSSSSEKCPMCSRVVRKPMRLQQCPRVRPRS